ncbi:hypothetical protein TNCV_1368531 [Trichonephila clavipes]|nr:hypothetical protein TNCV_1368531 [Trichonephila clavipes]
MCVCETVGLSKFSEKSDGQSVNRDRLYETETLVSGVKQRSEEKDELKIVAEELNLTVPEGAKIADLKSLIVNSDVYKKDKELVKSAIDYALAEIKNKRLDSETKLEFE